MNSLVEFYSELLEEWDYQKNVVSPSEVSYGNNKRVWWRCKEGHSWQATPNSRTNGKTGCPKCSHRKNKSGKKLTINDCFILEEWDYEKNVIKPKDVSCGSGKKVWWRCKEGHSWEARIVNRVKRKSGCPYCAGQKASNKNSLATKHPELLKEWDCEKNIVKPEDVSFGSHKKVWWKCKEGHSWQAKLNSRTSNRTGCPYCHKHKLLGSYSFSLKYPKLLKEWDYEKNVIKPEDVSFGSGKKVWWKCKEGHAWQSTPNSRTYMKSGCPYCAGHKVSDKNSLAIKYPELAKEWDYKKNVIKPEDVSFGSNKKVWWKCKKSHSWEATPNSRTNVKSGCPFCRKKRS